MRNVAYKLAVLLALAAPLRAPADSDPASLAQRLASRIAVHVDAATLATMTSLVAAKNFLDAAKAATDTSGYGDIFLFNLLAPMCTLTQDVNVDQTPCSATLQYLVWNNKPFTEALTGSYVAHFNHQLVNVPPSPTDNNHYHQASQYFDQGLLSYVATLVSSPQPLSDTMGVVTLPGAAAAGGFRGTNRRFIQLIFRSFLGVELEEIRDSSFGTSSALNDIRQDVLAGAPDATTMLQRCATCHGGLDAMARAFNKLDYPDSRPATATAAAFLAQFVMVPNTASENYGQIAQKILARELLYGSLPGFKESANSPTLTSWHINYHRSPYGEFAWGATSGDGVNTLGAAIAATLEFRINVVRRIWKLVCGQDVQPTDVPTVVDLANFMKTTAQDRVTPMVWQIATQPQCLGR